MRTAHFTVVPGGSCPRSWQRNLGVSVPCKPDACPHARLWPRASHCHSCSDRDTTWPPERVSKTLISLGRQRGELCTGPGQAWEQGHSPGGALGPQQLPQVCPHWGHRSDPCDSGTLSVKPLRCWSPSRACGLKGENSTQGTQGTQGTQPLHPQRARYPQGQLETGRDADPPCLLPVPLKTPLTKQKTRTVDPPGRAELSLLQQLSPAGKALSLATAMPCHGRREKLRTHVCAATPQPCLKHVLPQHPAGAPNTAESTHGSLWVSPACCVHQDQPSTGT